MPQVVNAWIGSCQISCTSAHLIVGTHEYGEQWHNGYRALDPKLREPRFYVCVSCRTLGKSICSTCYSSLICMNEYLPIYTGGYLYLNSVCWLIAMWLNVSQRSWDNVQLNRSAREETIKRCEESHKDWILHYVWTCLYYLFRLK